MGNSSTSFRSSELSQPSERSPLSSATFQGAIHEKSSISVVDEPYRLGWNVCLGGLGPRRFARAPETFKRRPEGDHGGSGQRHPGRSFGQRQVSDRSSQPDQRWFHLWR